MVAHAVKVQETTSVIFEAISNCKNKNQNHIAYRFNGPKANAKTYWSI